MKKYAVDQSNTWLSRYRSRSRSRLEQLAGLETEAVVLLNLMEK